MSLTNNFNFLSPTGFKLSIESPKFDNLEYFITTVSLPSMSLAEVSSSFQNQQGFVSGDQVNFDSLEVTFSVDEKMNNYNEVFNWIKETADSDTQVTNDIILSILTSHNNLNRQIRFVNAIPVSLGGVEFTTQASDIEYLQSNVSFRYDYFELIR
jgi:DNA polymerase III sliding clamp (beta) subunit (PCNA family)